jgi:hypothetical protein
MNIHEYAQQAMKHNKGIISSLELAKMVRASNPRFEDYSDQAMLKMISAALEPYGLKAKNVRLGDKVTRCYRNPPPDLSTIDFK